MVLQTSDHPEEPRNVLGLEPLRLLAQPFELNFCIASGIGRPRQIPDAAPHGRGDTILELNSIGAQCAAGPREATPEVGRALPTPGVSRAPLARVVLAEVAHRQQGGSLFGGSVGQVGGEPRRNVFYPPSRRS